MTYRPETQFRQNVKGVVLPLTAAIYLVYGGRSDDRGRPLGAFYPQNISATTWESLGGIWYRARDEQQVLDRECNEVVVTAFASSILTGAPVRLPSGALISWERIPEFQAAQLPPVLT